MTYQQREEYIAPVCEVLTFEVEEAITTAGTPEGAPVFHAGSDATQEDDDL